MPTLFKDMGIIAQEKFPSISRNTTDVKSMQFDVKGGGGAFISHQVKATTAREDGSVFLEWVLRYLLVVR